MGKRIHRRRGTPNGAALARQGANRREGTATSTERGKPDQSRRTTAGKTGESNYQDYDGWPGRKGHPHKWPDNVGQAERRRAVATRAQHGWTPVTSSP